jgi:hypothetical protein
VHNDTVTIVATDVAGNEAERSITVSVKTLVQGVTINGENAGVTINNKPPCATGNVVTLTR